MDTNKYKKIVEDISQKYKYSSNIKYILELIIPGFVLKYGLKNEGLILKCFRDIPIFIREREGEIKASFVRKLVKNKEEFLTLKRIILNSYEKANYKDLVEALVHEYNHALNSINKEIKEEKEFIYVRSGISFSWFLKDDFKEKKKENYVILEEVINVYQSEDIINKILNYHFLDYSLKEKQDFLKREIGSNIYLSSAYNLERMILNLLITNKSFITTLESLRLSGEIYEVDSWFDGMVNKKGEFKRMNETFEELFNLVKMLKRKDLFYTYKVNRIREKVNIIKGIISKFQESTIFK